METENTGNTEMKTSESKSAENLENKEKTEPVVNIEAALKQIEQDKVSKDNKVDQDEYIYDDIFVSEKDTFKVTVQYYKAGKEVVVESVDESFDNKREGIKSFEITFKYPSQRDQEIIMSSTFSKSLNKPHRILKL
jgi:hypothetical protein